MYQDINLQEALLGITITVNTIDHRTIRIPITDIIRSVKLLIKIGKKILTKL